MIIDVDNGSCVFVVCVVGLLWLLPKVGMLGLCVRHGTCSETIERKDIITVRRQTIVAITITSRREDEGRRVVMAILLAQRKGLIADQPLRSLSSMSETLGCRSDRFVFWHKASVLIFRTSS